MLFLRSLVNKSVCKVDVNPIITRIKKSANLEYNLYNEKGIKVKVCRDFFLRCLQVSSSSVSRSINTIAENINSVDHRGKNTSNKTNIEDITYLEAFIRKFPTFDSHYKASKSEKKYLSPCLNITRLYKEYCIVTAVTHRKTLSEWMFREIFNTKFNLSFHRPQTDTCKTCDLLKVQLIAAKQYEEKESILEKKRLHLEMVDKTNQRFVELRSLSEFKTEVFTFDLQRALELPRLSTSDAYYNRQLAYYNLCIYDEKRKIGHMYVWCETTSSRGAQEIASCLIKHLENYIPNDTERVILFSDSCPGQNKNIKLTMVLKLILERSSSLISIEHHFFVSGHSYNNCDQSFALIERQKRLTENIFVPKHWNNIIRLAKKTEPYFITPEMMKDDFFSCENLLKLIINRKISMEKEKINWFNI